MSNATPVEIAAISPVAGGHIPKDLASIPGISRGFNPPGVNHSRFTIRGLAGCGKSTLAHSNPRMFMLDPEGGGATVADPQALVYRAPETIPPGKQADAYKKAARDMITRYRQGNKEFSMLGIDTIDKLVRIFLDDFCVNEGIKDPLAFKDGRGNVYTIVKRDIFGLLDEALRAGMGWCLLAHVTHETIQVGEDKQIRPRLAVSPTFGVEVRRECEHMLSMEFIIRSRAKPAETKIINGKSKYTPATTGIEEVRQLRTRPGGTWQGEPAHEVKVRLPFPDKMEIPPIGGWGVIEAGYDEGIRILTANKGRVKGDRV